MRKPDTINAEPGHPDFHGFNWRVTLNGEAIDGCLSASRLGGYVVRVKKNDGITAINKDGGVESETLFGVVDYERTAAEGEV